MSTASIYDQHRKHTARVGAYVVLNGAEPVARITIAYPKDGASRLYAYVHVLGVPMVRGSATGYGYDKRSAAIASAAHGLASELVKMDATNTQDRRFLDAIVNDDGNGWDRNLATAGFTVVCVCE